LENVKEAVAKFKKRLSAKVRRQEKLDVAKEIDFRKGELLGSIQQRYCIGRIMKSLKTSI